MENKFNKESITVIAKSKLFRARLGTGFVDSKETAPDNVVKSTS